jgi:5-methylcytosine-specific restriction endonuclease McrA
MDEHTTLWLLYKGLHHYLGKKMNSRYRYCRKLFLIQNNPTHCYYCKNYTSPKSRTIDHLIPRKTIIELNLSHLLTDPRNFAMSCQTCNNEKGDTEDHLPPAVQAKLAKLRASSAP